MADSTGASTQTQVGGSHPGNAPRKIGKYEIRGELGRGSCGVVYKGFDPFVQRDVAIKVAEYDPTKFKGGSSAVATRQRPSRCGGRRRSTSTGWSSASPT